MHPETKMQRGRPVQFSSKQMQDFANIDINTEMQDFVDYLNNVIGIKMQDHQLAIMRQLLKAKKRK